MCGGCLPARCWRVERRERLHGRERGEPLLRTGEIQGTARYVPKNRHHAAVKRGILSTENIIFTHIQRLCLVVVVVESFV